MEIIKTGIKGLVEIKPKVFGDERGCFFESFREDALKSAGISEHFVQDNQSFSRKGVVRGLHFQQGEHAQGKLVRVTEGKVLDVAVDLRPESPTFGQHRSVVLDSKSHNMLYVPPGMAHGFATLEDAVFLYKCTAYYNKESEGGILWNDQDLCIDWRIENPVISEKDAVLPTFAQWVANNTQNSRA
ncbi:dTDP-4-dehydrorhamnose 3,5-epimerase [Fulvitalea axinellae]|uniref:dTDP-4-dehydrorhamnose 3,5-epimerase n=1 Tax=Fulvitalea axinellae TaxID=1182444 RepID=A0AAU9CEC7_9BACT|nr:dTDP-4-dehydrorhamnose 3,5-epimerase [Fulvitalea axinellae]